MIIPTKNIIVLMFYLFFFLKASTQQVIVVDARGNGDFISIQAAINSISDSATTTRNIFIRSGVYKEKVLIEKHNISIKGEDKYNTVISQSIARDIFRCDNEDDWGVATVNLKGNDITLENLTIVNSYGFDNKASLKIACLTDSLVQEKLVKNDGHQMALRSFSSTRLKVINCILKAFGGDTVSPWNLDAGMFYFKDCSLEGGVDFYCPRGWAYAENCNFYAHGGSAAIWHDGSKHQSSKTVLVNCHFDGYEGFKLGRWHKDAQFYLINCSFNKSMSDSPIYLVKTTNTIQWGSRQFYFNCHRVGGDFAWFNDNMDAQTASKINANWVFENKWNF